MRDLTQSMFSTAQLRRWGVAAALAVTAALGASQAQARDVHWSVGVSSPGVAVNASTAPVYVTPAPIYVTPHAPRRPVYHAPHRPVYYVVKPERGYHDRHRRGHGHRHHHRRDRHDRD